MSLRPFAPPSLSPELLSACKRPPLCDLTVAREKRSQFSLSSDSESLRNPGSRFSQPHQSTGPPVNLLCQSTGPCEIPQVRSEDSQSYSPPSIPLHLVPDEPACHRALQNPAPAVSAPPGVQPVMDIAHWKFHMQSICKQVCLKISYTSERIKF